MTLSCRCRTNNDLNAVESELRIKFMKRHTLSPQNSDVFAQPEGFIRDTMMPHWSNLDFGPTGGFFITDLLRGSNRFYSRFNHKNPCSSRGISLTEPCADQNCLFEWYSLCYFEYEYIGSHRGSYFKIQYNCRC